MRCMCASANPFRKYHSENRKNHLICVALNECRIIFDEYAWTQAKCNGLWNFDSRKYSLFTEIVHNNIRPKSTSHALLYSRSCEGNFVCWIWGFCPLRGGKKEEGRRQQRRRPSNRNYIAHSRAFGSVACAFQDIFVVHLSSTRILIPLIWLCRVHRAHCTLDMYSHLHNSLSCVNWKASFEFLNLSIVPMCWYFKPAVQLSSFHCVLVWAYESMATLGHIICILKWMQDAFKHHIIRSSILRRRKSHNFTYFVCACCCCCCRSFHF